MSASDKHVLDYEGLQYFKTKIYSDLKTINGAAITGGGNLSLVVANSAITGATKCKITYDSKGLVTGGANLAASDIPSLAASKITSGTFDVARIPSLAASKIASGTFDVARIPSLAISKITDLQTSLDAKLAVKPDGTNDLIDNNKVSIKYLPDVVLGQLVFGGTVTGAGVATLSTNAKTKLGTTSSSITLTNNTTAITGYKANEGIFYVVTSDGSFASLGLKTGDWLISTGDSWRKVDNTDEVTSVQIKGTANVLSSSTATAQTGVVVTTLNLVAGHGDTVNPYGSKTANYVLAAPNGSAGTPSFRKLVAADIPSLAASKITSGTFDAARIPSLAISKITNLQTELDAKVVANSAITGATKCKITYDSKGLITGGADLAASDIPSLAASKITSGTFDTARIPTLAISKISGLQSALDSKVTAASSNRPGVTRLYRREDNTGYSVQTEWTGYYWLLQGYYSDDTYHGGCQVAYANNAGYATSAGSAQPVFNNSTWYNVGDDVAIGDHDVAGTLCIKGLNGTPGIRLYSSSGSYYADVITSANIGSYIPAATKLYCHVITCTLQNGSGTGTLTIYSTRAEAYTSPSQFQIAHYGESNVIAAYWNNQICYSSSYRGSYGVIYFYANTGTTNYGEINITSISDSVTAL